MLAGFALFGSELMAGLQFAFSFCCSDLIFD